MTRSQRIARYESQRKAAEDRMFVKQFHRIRMSLYHLREGGVLHTYLNSQERVTQKVNERMFAEEDDKLLGRLMDLRQFIGYANDQEAKVAECIWRAKQDGFHEVEIARSCSQQPVWTFTPNWVARQVAWHDRTVRVKQASQVWSADNKLNKLMAFAWAIANS